MEIPKKSAKKTKWVVCFSVHTNLSKQIGNSPEELLKAFKSMETQVLKIVEQSYADQIDNDKTYLEKENIWLKDKIKE